MKTTATISGYHAHIYFDADSLPAAEILIALASQQFPISVGHILKQPVGPHPRWSCQLAFAPVLFAELIPWLAQHRGDLTVFIHMITGDDYIDHTQHTLWMGEMLPLNLSIFTTNR